MDRLIALTGRIGKIRSSVSAYKLFQNQAPERISSSSCPTLSLYSYDTVPHHHLKATVRPHIVSSSSCPTLSLYSQDTVPHHNLKATVWPHVVTVQLLYVPYFHCTAMVQSHIVTVNRRLPAKEIVQQRCPRYCRFTVNTWDCTAAVRWHR